MSYRLRDDESVAKGLERITRDELGRAIDRLTAANVSAADVHEARKSIKKVRAILQLVGPRIASGSAPKRLRKAAHLLSPLRDADAVTASARTLCRGRGMVVERQCSGIRRQLEMRKTRIATSARRDRVYECAARSLEEVRRSAKRFDWKHVNLSTLVLATRASYKRARRSMDRARARNQAVAFHSWRKRVKTLWYALRLLEERMAVDRPIASLKRIQNSLGEDHNLAVLGTRLVKRRGTDGQRLKGLAERRQQQLRRIALRLGASRFHLPPKEFARSVKRVRHRTAGRERG